MSERDVAKSETASERVEHATPDDEKSRSIGSSQHTHDDDADSRSVRSNESYAHPLTRSVSEVRDGIESRRDVELGEPIEKHVSQRSASGDPNLVTWDGPDDPENPKLWSFHKKWAAVVVGKQSISSSLLQTNYSRTCQLRASYSQLLYPDLARLIDNDSSRSRRYQS
jgi:hypothetical protein